MSSDQQLQPGAKTHLVLATIDESVRAVSIRILGAYTESIGVRTTLLMIVKSIASFGRPVGFTDGEIRKVAQFLEREGVTHLGFYLMTASLKPYRLLVKALREHGFKGVILAGGVHVSLCPEESLVDGADYAVRGPGEIPLQMLLENKAPDSIPGLVWRKDGAIRVNPVSEAQKLDPDKLPLPIFRFHTDMVLVGGRLRPLTWALRRKYSSWHGVYYDLISSRGCVYRCAFCCNVEGAPVRRAGVDRIIRELKAIKENHPQIKGVNIHDDSFFAGDDKWTDEFCRRMKAEVGLPFIARMIPRFVTRERLERYKEGGLEYVTIGLEGSDRLNKLFNRNETSASFLKAARTVLEANLILTVDVLIHDPYETEQDLREVALTVNQLPRPNWWITALALTPFPGTALHIRAEKDGMLKKFATDPYDSMLIPSREGAYLTPPFWIRMFLFVLPHVNPKLGERLIELGPDDPRAVQTVERLSKWISRMKRATTWTHFHMPLLYAIFYRFLRLFAGRRALPKAMTRVIVD